MGLSLEVLPSLRDSFLELLLNVERDLLKMNKMLLSLSWPTLNPLNATDVSSATWLLVPSPTKAKSCPFSTQRPQLSPPNLNTSLLPRLANWSEMPVLAKSVTAAH